MSTAPGELGAERRVLDEAGGLRAMTAVMAIMVFLCMLAAALGLATASAARSLDERLEGRLTVQVTAGDADAREAAARRIAARLRGMAGVRNAVPVDRATLARLLRPWLGDAGSDPELPVPAMIDVDVSGDPDVVAVAVREESPTARVDRHAAWMSPVGGFMRTLTWLAGGIVLLMASATAAVVVLAARSGLETHRATIEVMHMLGATDVQVARLFQRRIAIDAAIGGIGGGLLAVLVIALLGSRTAALGSELLAAVSLGTVDWVLVAALPVLFIILGTLAARVAVTRELRRTL